MDTQIDVSICCLTYNHETYIRKCLDGFIMQKDVSFEILIHDDASTDKTQEIIKEYEKKYSNIIKPIYQTENQHSKGVKISDTYQYPRAIGKYIAMCEGDDYWTDPYKLKKQIDALESHLNCSICVHDVQYIKENGDIINDKKIPYVKFSEGVLKYEEICKHGLVCPFQMSSYFFETKTIKKYLSDRPECLCNVGIGDVPLLLFCVLNGDFYYIGSTMSCYRCQSSGSWSSRTTGQKMTDHRLTMIKMYEEFQKYTNDKYDVTPIINNYRFNLLVYQEQYRKALKLLKKTPHKNIPFSILLKIRIKAYIPFVARIIRKKKSKNKG